MNLPNLEKQTISFAFGGFELLSNDEIQSKQVGYSHLEDGTNICSIAEGNWRSEWIIIGWNSLQGDPIFLDCSDHEYPVYTAAHGGGAWDPNLLSSSYSGFLEILKELKILASTRPHPVALQENPMTQEEYDSFIECCIKFGRLDDPYLWEIMVEDEEAGVGPEI